MAEVLFILFILFVAYIIYKPTGEHKATNQVAAQPIKQEQPKAANASRAVAEKSAEVVKTSTTTRSRPAAKRAQATVAKPVASPAKAKGANVPEIVGLAAGSIWKYLDDNGPTTVAKLVRELKENEKTIQRGIGWLAQEEKITLSTVDRAETIALKK